MTENDDKNCIFDSLDMQKQMVGIKRVLIWEGKEVEYFLDNGSSDSAKLCSNATKGDWVICIRNPNSDKMEGTVYKEKEEGIEVNICIQVLDYIAKNWVV